jgi:hypothetical protein
MFRSNDHHQGAYCLYFAKVILLNGSVKIRRYGTSSVVWLHIYPVLMVCVQSTVQSKTVKQ